MKEEKKLNLKCEKSPAHRHRVEDLDRAMTRAWALRDASRPEAAERLCREVVDGHAEFGQAWHLLGLICLDSGDTERAVTHLKRAVSVEPHQPLHYNNLAVALNEMKSHESAVTFLEKALAISPGYHDARCNLGLSLYYLGRLHPAAECFSTIIDTEPDHTAALANLGMTRLAQQDCHSAARAYQRAIALDGNHPDWHGNLAAALMRMSRFAEAAVCYRQALSLDPRNVDFMIRLGIASRAAGDLDGSVAALESALSADPGNGEAIAHLVVDLEYTCQWDRLEELYPTLSQATQTALRHDMTPDEDPMLNIRRCCEITTNRAVAEAWSRKSEMRARQVMAPIAHHRPARVKESLTVAYLSYDFRNHPVAHQLHPLFSGHDRRRFRIIAFSMGPDDGSAYRRRIEGGCDEFIDISALGLEQAARSIRERRPDILVDLMGHSHHHRMELLSLRCAPLQVSYLGFLSTTGCASVDYIVADRIVAPRAHETCYSEKLLRMPHCYQMNHSLQIGEGNGRTRTQWGLPDEGFVYASFNNAYKIDRQLFAAWMGILAQVPDSVLWLSGAHPRAVKQMNKMARQTSIDPDRLIFAEKLPLPEHLERLRAADLALDTLRYNGGATTSNALSVGLPVLTVMGRHWVSRMTASHLHAANMAGLVFDEPDAYCRAAVVLGLDPQRLIAIRQRLAINLAASPLFDHHAFVRHLEYGYEQIWRRHLNGLAPCAMDIPDLAGELS